MKGLKAWLLDGWRAITDLAYWKTLLLTTIFTLTLEFFVELGHTVYMITHGVDHPTILFGGGWGFVAHTIIFFVIYFRVYRWTHPVKTETTVDPSEVPWL
jgi:hypothetical protein